MRPTVTTVLLTVLALVATRGSALAQSCAMCGSSFGPGDPTGRAISYSILFLMAAPYTLLTVIGGWLYFMYRRAGGRRRASVLHLPWARQNPPPTA
jgi:hypothetical protein